MSAIIQKEAYPRVMSAERDGWKITVRCEGVYTEFIMMEAQAGQAKGAVVLEGPEGMMVSIGTGRRHCPRCHTCVEQFPINLSRGCGDLTSRLCNELRDKYNVTPNREFIENLGEKVFPPYFLPMGSI